MDSWQLDDSGEIEESKGKAEWKWSVWLEVCNLCCCQRANANRYSLFIMKGREKQRERGEPYQAFLMTDFEQGRVNISRDERKDVKSDSCGTEEAPKMKYCCN